MDGLGLRSIQRYYKIFGQEVIKFLTQTHALNRIDSLDHCVAIFSISYACVTFDAIIRSEKIATHLI